MNTDATILRMIITSALGGGGVCALGLLALKEYLRKEFATKADVNGVGTRVNEIEADAARARDRADEAANHAIRLETIQQQQWERIAQHIIRPLEKMVERMDSLATSQARISEQVDNLRRSPHTSRENDS